MQEIAIRKADLIDSIPQKGGVHDAMLARELVSGKRLRVPKCRIGEFVIGQNYSTSNVKKAKGFDKLYLGPHNNGSDHHVFNLVRYWWYMYQDARNHQ